MKFIFLNLKKILFCKIYFKIPKPSKIVVYDRGHSELIKKFIKKKKIHIFDVRFESINLPVLLMSIWEGGFRNLSKQYIKKYFSYLKPKLIITFIDYNPTFYQLKSILNDFSIKLIAIQSSVRVKRNYKAFKVKNLNRYLADYILLHSKEYKQYYEQYIKSKYLVVGSFKNNSIKKINGSGNQKKIIYISQFKEKVSQTREHFREKKLLNFLSDYCNLKKIKIYIAIKNNITERLDINSSSDFNYAKSVYSKYFNLKKNINIVGETDGLNNYNHVDNSELIVFESSTLGYEAFARGKKILIFPIDQNIKQKNFFCVTKLNYKILEKKLDLILSMNLKDWRKKTKNSILLSKFDNGNKKFYNLINKLS